MQIRAAVLRQVNTPLSVEEVELDSPRRGEVMLQMSAAGICGSDLHAITGAHPALLPQVRGHEGSGTVIQVGEGVTQLAVGDPVVTSFVASCGHCHHCIRGRRTSCVNGIGPTDGTLLDGTYRMRDSNGRPVGTGSRLGAFATHSVVPVINCIKVPADTNMVPAALLSCGFSTGMGAAVHVARVQMGETVVVFGVGGVGVAAIQGARLAGASEIIAVDIHPSKDAVSRAFGATHFVDATNTDVVTAVRDYTGGFGADAALLTMTMVRAENITAAMECLGPGGRGVMVSAPEAGLTNVPFSPGAMMFSQKSFHATLAGTMDTSADILRYVDLYRTGRLQLDELITTRYQLDDINKAFDDLRAGMNIRGVIVHNA